MNLNFCIWFFNSENFDKYWLYKVINKLFSSLWNSLVCLNYLSVKSLCLKVVQFKPFFFKNLAQIIFNFSKIHQKKFNWIYSQIVQVLQAPKYKGVGTHWHGYTICLRGLLIYPHVGRRTCYNRPFVSHVLFVKLLGVLPCSTSRKRLQTIPQLLLALWEKIRN